MSDDTLQGGLDTLMTEELTTRNGVAVSSGVKAEVAKIAYGDPHDARDVSVLFPLPIAAGINVETTASIFHTVSGQTPAATTPIDVSRYRWISVHLWRFYTGQTSLTLQGSNDGTNWVSVGLTSIGATSSGLTTTPNQTTGVYVGPVNFKWFRMLPGGAWTAGSTDAVIELYTAPGQLNSMGVNASISNPHNAGYTIGTSGGNIWFQKATGSGTVTATQILAGVSGLATYVTDISWYNTGATDTILTLQAASSQSIIKEFLLKAGGQDARALKLPWRITTSTNVALQYLISAATTSWQFEISGYYA